MLPAERHTNCAPNEVGRSWKGGARERADDVFFATGIKRRRSKADFAPTWRSGRDSNPRGIAPKLISSQPRYDHFDTAADMSTRMCDVCLIRIPDFQPKIKRQPEISSGRRAGCQKSPRTFSAACKNAVTFPPHSVGKVLAALAERLAAQDVQRIRSHSRRAAAPLELPRQN